MLYHGKSLVPGRNTVVRNAKLYRMNRWMEDCGKNTLLYKKINTQYEVTEWLGKT